MANQAKDLQNGKTVGQRPTQCPGAVTPVCEHRSATLVLGPAYEYLFRHICCDSFLSAEDKGACASRKRRFGFLVLSMLKIHLNAEKSFWTVRQGCFPKNGTMRLRCAQAQHIS